MSCDVGHRHSSDLALLWLWCRLAATAPIRPLTWEPAYAAGAALKRKNTKKRKKERKKEKEKKMFSVTNDVDPLFMFISCSYCVCV